MTSNKNIAVTISGTCVEDCLADCLLLNIKVGFSLPVDNGAIFLVNVFGSEDNLSAWKRKWGVSDVESSGVVFGR